MPEQSEVVVARKNMRWEVSVGRVTRPLIDWLCTKDRAVHHALERAREVGAESVVVATWDGSVDEVIRLARSAA